MSARQTSQLLVTWDQVVAFRLARQHLRERAPTKALISVVGDMAGAQAQLPSAAYISLWTRVRNLRLAQIDQALSERRLVKASGMRHTLFLLPADQLAMFIWGTAKRAEKELNWARGKGVDDRALDAAIEAALGVLDQPLTRPEIAEQVCRVLGVPTQTYHGGGWGNRRQLAAVPVGHLNYPVVDLLHLAAARGVICYGPNRGNEPTFVRADAWLPEWRDLSVERAEDLLLRTYLRAYGPATAADFAMWSGLSLTEARKIWARAQADITAVTVEGWAASILQADLTALTRAKFDRPHVRLLPYFDVYLLGHKERDHLAAAQHRMKIYRAQGWVSPVVLVDGRAVAVWSHTRLGNRLTLNVTPFESLSRRVVAGIREEARDLGRFLEATDVDVQIE